MTAAEPPVPRETDGGFGDPVRFWNDRADAPADGRWEEAHEAAWEALGRRPFRVLDLGAGTGRDSLPLLGRGCQVTAVEKAPRLAELLRAASGPGGEAVSVREHDLRDFRAAAGSFDLAVCSLVLHYLPRAEAVAVLGEVRRAVRPGGFALLRLFAAGGELRFGSDAFVPADREIESLFDGWRVIRRDDGQIPTAERHPDDTPKRHRRGEWLLGKPEPGTGRELAELAEGGRAGLRRLLSGDA